ncbi:hypothetical protein B0T11DRAFT_7516 [Plectosphaerella cucumerina]|uniref:DUF7707 domain-containing protein n=1 Tax=Plectosphaerella cucumerina TaxID=40658 RepID=A0A8K0TRY8_9PEZI|nr:hypothetical protein B0T11DRAFT_7516 [Plectosphaerella cucumerina]
MPSFKSSFLAVAAAFAATASAQQFYDIDPETVPSGVRVRWCDDQVRSCKGICAQTAEGDPLVNDCDSDALRYGCICSDGNKPNVTEYSLTLPFHMCQEWGNQCVAACGLANNQCSSDCRENNPCGAQDPQRVNATSSTSAGPEATAATTTTSSNGGIFTGLNGAGPEDEDDSTDSPSAAAVLESNRALGAALLIGGFLGGFAFLL